MLRIEEQETDPYERPLLLSNISTLGVVVQPSEDVSPEIQEIL